MKCEDINLRDPFILVHNDTYYLYGTRSETAFIGQAYGFDVYKSKDLTEWEGPIEVLKRPENFFSKKSYWAPEVYEYNNRFFMFATFADTKKGLGTMVLSATSPEGPFEVWSDGYITPKDSRCLDGTLYISKENVPYMVYCHEWKEIHDGTVCAVQLSDDLKRSVSEPIILFSASAAKPFVKKYFFKNYVTDGPYIVRTDDDKIHLLWSTYANNGYVEALAHSDNNEITGKWEIEKELLYDHDGGHGMIFKDLSGHYKLTLHYPNTFRKEHPKFIDVIYENGNWNKVN